MRIINKISRIIFITFILLLFSIVLVTLTYNPENIKVCRNNITFEKRYYQNISNILEIKELSNCDKISLFVTLSENINKENINGIILNIINVKKTYNDEIILELFMKNNDLSCIVLIDENESFDIDFTF